MGSKSFFINQKITGQTSGAIRANSNHLRKPTEWASIKLQYRLFLIVHALIKMFSHNRIRHPTKCAWRSLHLQRERANSAQPLQTAQCPAGHSQPDDIFPARKTHLCVLRKARGMERLLKKCQIRNQLVRECMAECLGVYVLIVSILFFPPMPLKHS